MADKCGDLGVPIPGIVGWSHGCGMSLAGKEPESVWEVEWYQLVLTSWLTCTCSIGALEPNSWILFWSCPACETPGGRGDTVKVKEAVKLKKEAFSAWLARGLINSR